MGLTKQTKIHFDGKEPYATNGTADRRGAYHFPKLRQGSTIIFDLEFEDDNGDLVDLTTLTSATYECDFRANYADATEEVTASFTTPTTTTLRVRIEASDTANFAATDDDERVWDLEIKYDDGGTEMHVDSPVGGNYEFLKEASK